jgi:hypothetical protein
MNLSELEGDPHLIQLKDHYSIRYFILAHRYINYMRSIPDTDTAKQDSSEFDFCEAQGMSDSDFDYMTAAMDLLEAEGALG